MSITEAVLEKLNALPPEKQELVLDYVETLGATPPTATSSQTDPCEWLNIASQMNLDGPPDWSERFEEYLHGTPGDAGR